MNTTNIALSSVAMTKSSEAKKIACHAFMKDFKHNKSTQAMQIQYADCVREIYPSDTGLYIGLILIFILGIALFQATKI